MTVHTANRTAPNELCGQRQTPPAGSYPVVASSVHSLISAQAENDRQQLLVFNPSPARDSIAEHIAALLRADADPAQVAAEVLPLLRELLESEQRERGHERDATGPLDLLARALAVHPERQGLGIKRAAARLRPALRVVRRADTELVPAAEYFPACCAIKDIIGELPSTALRSSSMRNALGTNQTQTGLHDVLLGLLTDGEEH